MNFNQLWNRDLREISDVLFSDLKEEFGAVCTEENLDSYVMDFITVKQRKDFFIYFDQTYGINLRHEDSRFIRINELCYKIYRKRISDYFEAYGINPDYETDFDFFQNFMSGSKNLMKDHIRKVLQKGTIFCVNDDYICIQWMSSVFGTTLMIGKEEESFKVISVYPECYECNRISVSKLDFDEDSDGWQISACANSCDFSDTHFMFENEHFSMSTDDELNFCYFGIAESVKLLPWEPHEFHLPKHQMCDECNVIEIDKTKLLKAPAVTKKIKVRLHDLYEFKSFGRKCCLFKWNGSKELDGEGCFDEGEEIPVIIPTGVLPRRTDLCEDDVVELVLTVYAHMAVYMNPDEPNLEKYKFEMMLKLDGKKRKTRFEYDAEKKQKKEKKTVELKNRTSDFMLRVFDDSNDWESQLMEQCSAFYKKHGIYPNVIIANPKTYEAWFESVEKNISDSIAADSDYPDEEVFIDDAENINPVCELKEAGNDSGTVFKTRDYELFLIENEDFQKGVYEILNGYSTALEENCFMYPVVDGEATGKKIRGMMDKKGVTPLMIQKVLGGVSLQAIYNWFSGKSMPWLDNFAVIANMLDTSIDELLVVQLQKRAPFRENKE